SRAQDSAEVVAARMAKASDEISHYPEYDYIVVNDDLDRSVRSVRAILAAERLRRERQNGMTEFVRTLQAEGD
ncbi:MAG: guanylate kinase, partial [Candidatus Puniceispirillaceae bacterium]